jgi:hypothetical protein
LPLPPNLTLLAETMAMTGNAMGSSAKKQNSSELKIKTNLENSTNWRFHPNQNSKSALHRSLQSSLEL